MAVCILKPHYKYTPNAIETGILLLTSANLTILPTFHSHIPRDPKAELLSPTQRLLNTPQFHHFAIGDTNEVGSCQHNLLARRRKTSKHSQMCSPQNKTKCDCILFTNHLLNSNTSIRKTIPKSLYLMFHTLRARNLIWTCMIDKISCKNLICKSEVPYFVFFSATFLIPVNQLVKACCVITNALNYFIVFFLVIQISYNRIFHFASSIGWTHQKSYENASKE